MKPKYAALVFAMSVTLLADSSAQVTYSFENDTETRFLSRDGSTPVDNDLGGDQSISGNNQGALIQIGWFDGQTFGNFSGTAFDGTFQPLVEFFSGDSANTTQNTLDGTMTLSWSFDATGYNKYYGDGAPAQDDGPYIGTPPPSNQQRYLAVRWYDTQDTSGFYNTVTSEAWLWVGTTFPGPGTIMEFYEVAGVFLESTGQELTSGSQLVASIPEPGITGLAFAALGLMAFMRRRKA